MADTVDPFRDQRRLSVMSSTTDPFRTQRRLSVMSNTADPFRTLRRLSATDEATPLLLASGPGIVPNNAIYDDSKSSTPDERSPLLHGISHEPGEESDEEEEKPMPIAQILLLCYAALAEPVAYFAIFPFMPEMIYRTSNLEQSDVGFWTGLIESLFSLVQMVLMMFYGRAADKLGRKPVLVFSLAGMSVFTALFGMSQTLWQMVLCRCLTGVFAGSVVTVRTMLSENCTYESQARAFSWYQFTKNLGIFIGPLIGGGLANPAEQFPNVFGNIPFFSNFPYALSTFVVGAVCLSATLTSLFGLKETVNRGDDPEAKGKAEMSVWEVLKSPGVPIVLYIYGHTMGLALAYTAVNPVFLYTDVKLGGWGFSDQRIALFTAVAGASQSLWMLIPFPPLQRRLGTGNLLRVCAVIWPLMMASFPISNELLRHDHKTAFWAFFPPSLILGSGISMAYACVQLCMNDISPSSNVLATVNALALTVNSGVRAVAPVAFTSIYAVGVRLQWADGHLIWFILVAIALGLNVAIYFLPAQAEGRYKKPKQRQNDEDGQEGI